MRNRFILGNLAFLACLIIFFNNFSYEINIDEQNSRFKSALSLSTKADLEQSFSSIRKKRISIATVPENIDRIAQPRPIGESNHVLVTFAYKNKPELREVGLYSFDTGELKCLTCGLLTMGVEHGSFSRPIPISDERIVVQGISGSKVIGNFAFFTFHVLQCVPSILNCEHISIEEISNTKQKGDLTVRFHVPSPDGKKLVWEAIRPQGGLTKLGSIWLMQGDLQRDRSGKYRVANPSVINPPSFQSAITTPEALAIRSTYFEPKEFCNGGKELLLNSTLYRSTDVDNYMLNLASGNLTRLTTSAGWDEGGSCSPNNNLLVQAVQRVDKSASAFSALSRPPFLDGIQAMGNLSNYYVVGEDGKDWPRRGGRRSVVLFPIAGEATGQELQLSEGEKDGWFVGTEEAVFFEDNKRLVWGETKEMTSEGRLVLMEIETDLSATPNPEYVSLPNPPWAVTSSAYSKMLKNRPKIIEDGQGGTAEISEAFAPRSRNVVTKIVYSNFHWQDARLNGQEKVTLIFPKEKEEEALGQLPYYTNIETNIKSDGDLVGYLNMNVNIFEGCGENVTPYSSVVNGVAFSTPWPMLGSDCKQ